MKYYCCILLGFLYSYPLTGQDNTSLTALLDQIKTLVVEVPGKSNTYNQELTWDETLPYKIIFTTDITNKKGKTEEWVYELSLRDVDKNTIRNKTDKDLKIVPLIIDNRRKMIKVFKEGKQEKYRDKLEIAALNSDNAKSLEELLKQAVQIAQKVNPPGLPVSFDDRMAWLRQHIVPLEVDGTTYDQAFEQEEALSTMVTYTFSKQNDKSVEETWLLNLGDFKERTVKLEIKGKELQVKMQTNRNQKFVQYEKAGKQENYTNKVVFYVDDTDRGQMMVEVLREVVAEAVKMEKVRLPEIPDLPTALDLLSAQITELEINGRQYTQTITPDCVTTLTRQETDTKGNTKEEKWRFNLADLSNKVPIKVSGKGIHLDLTTGKHKLLQHFREGEMQSYSNKNKIRAKDVENAKWLAHVLPKAIQYCKTESPDDQFTAKGSNFDWIKQNIPELDDLQQTLEKTDDAECKWQFSTVKSGKKEIEETYEFNLYDLDPKTVDFKISGKTLAVQVFTRNKEDNIKYYKNGEPGNYKDNFLIQMDHIEKAREMMAVWKAAMEGCEVE